MCADNLTSQSKARALVRKGSSTSWVNPLKGDELLTESKEIFKSGSCTPTNGKRKVSKTNSVESVATESTRPCSPSTSSERDDITMRISNTSLPPIPPPPAGDMSPMTPDSASSSASRKKLLLSPRARKSGSKKTKSKSLELKSSDLPPKGKATRKSLGDSLSSVPSDFGRGSTHSKDATASTASMQTEETAGTMASERLNRFERQKFSTVEEPQQQDEREIDMEGTMPIRDEDDNNTASSGSRSTRRRSKSASKLLSPRGRGRKQRSPSSRKKRSVILGEQQEGSATTSDETTAVPLDLPGVTLSREHVRSSSVPKSPKQTKKSSKKKRSKSAPKRRADIILPTDEEEPLMADDDLDASSRSAMAAMEGGALPIREEKKEVEKPRKRSLSVPKFLKGKMSTRRSRYSSVAQEQETPAATTPKGTPKKRASSWEELTKAFRRSESDSKLHVSADKDDSTSAPLKKGKKSRRQSLAASSKINTPVEEKVEQPSTDQRGSGKKEGAMSGQLLRSSSDSKLAAEENASTSPSKSHKKNKKNRRMSMSEHCPSTSITDDGEQGKQKSEKVAEDEESVTSLKSPKGKTSKKAKVVKLGALLRSSSDSKLAVEEDHASTRSSNSHKKNRRKSMSEHCRSTFINEDEKQKVGIVSEDEKSSTSLTSPKTKKSKKAKLGKSPKKSKKRKSKKEVAVSKDPLPGVPETEKLEAPFDADFPALEVEAPSTEMMAMDISWQQRVGLDDDELSYESLKDSLSPTRPLSKDGDKMEIWSHHSYGSISLNASLSSNITFGEIPESVAPKVLQDGTISTRILDYPLTKSIMKVPFEEPRPPLQRGYYGSGLNYVESEDDDDESIKSHDKEEDWEEQKKDEVEIKSPRLDAFLDNGFSHQKRGFRDSDSGDVSIPTVDDSIGWESFDRKAVVPSGSKDDDSLDKNDIFGQADIFTACYSASSRDTLSRSSRGEGSAGSGARKKLVSHDWTAPVDASLHWSSHHKRAMDEDVFGEDSAAFLATDTVLAKPLEDDFEEDFAEEEFGDDVFPTPNNIDGVQEEYDNEERIEELASLEMVPPMINRSDSGMFSVEDDAPFAEEEEFGEQELKTGNSPTPSSPFRILQMTPRTARKHLLAASNQSSSLERIEAPVL